MDYQLPSHRLDTQFLTYKNSYGDKQARSEAARCLYCYDAPCIKACATAINIPEFIRKIGSANLKGAAKTILDSNILGLSCSMVCPVDVMCEGSCVYNQSGEQPVHIGLLQEYAVRKAYQEDWHFFEKGPCRDKKIALVGAGPSGLACAHELTRLGYTAVVFEAKPIPGGLTTWAIAPYKFSAEDSLREVEYVQTIGFEIRTNTEIGKDKTFADLDREFSAIFVGVGLGLDREMAIPGEGLAGYFGGLETIQQIRMEGGFSLKEVQKAVVIGGGNTSVDLVRELKQLGVLNVTLVYRRGETEMNAYKHEREAAKKEGVHFQILSQPVEILGEKDRVNGVKCLAMELGEVDESGRKRPVAIPDSEFVIPADHVYVAIGQPPLSEFLQSIPGLELDRGFAVKVDPTTYQTGNPKVFAGGDCVTGGKEVVNSVAHGRDAARAIDKYLTIQEGA